jgi:RNA polymerase sigma factor (sigma-70 family)
MSCPDEIVTRESISALYQNHAKELMVFANSILKNPDDAREIVHDLFCTLYEKVPEKKLFRNTIRAFLYVSVKNLSLNLIQKKRKSAQLSEEYGTADNQFEKINDRLTGETITNYINYTFSKSQNEIFHLRTVHGLTWKEIADITGISLSSAYREFDAMISQIKRKFSDVF